MVSATDEHSRPTFSNKGMLKRGEEIVVTLASHPWHPRKAKAIRDAFRQDSTFRRSVSSRRIRFVPTVSGVSMPEIGTQASLRVDQNVIGRLAKSAGSGHVSKAKSYLIRGNGKQVYDRKTWPKREVVELLDSLGLELEKCLVGAESGDGITKENLPIRVLPMAALNLAHLIVDPLEGRRLEVAAFYRGIQCTSMPYLPTHTTPTPKKAASKSSCNIGKFHSHTPSSSNFLDWKSETTSSNPYATLGFIDSGIDVDEEDLSGLDSISFARFDQQNGRIISTTPSESNGHGTCVISKAVGNKSGILTKSKIAVAACLDEHGECQPIALMHGLTWLLSQESVRVINISLGQCNSWGQSIYSDVWKDIITSALVSYGVFVVAATGNSGEGFIAAPAAYSEVESVGAYREAQERDGNGSNFWDESGHGYVKEEQNTFNPFWIAEGSPTIENRKIKTDVTATSFAAPVVSAIILRAIRDGVAPLTLLNEYSEPSIVGEGIHQGTVRKISWPIPISTTLSSFDPVEPKTIGK